jgi:hypothetical protein
MPVRVTSYHTYTVATEGGDIRLRLVRMPPAEFEEFRAHFLANGQGRGAPADDAPLEDRITYLRRNAAWCEGVFARFVSVVEGDLEYVDDDGGQHTITDGREFARLYQAEAADVLAELYLLNGLTEAQKKTWRSARGSGTGSSTAQSPAAAGPTPVTTAAPAENEASAAREGVTAPNSGAWSGTTDRSCSEPVPCDS